MLTNITAALKRIIIMPSYRRSGDGDNNNNNSLPAHQHCKPILLLVSFLLYLNFALLGHLTNNDSHARRYFREVFPSDTTTVGGVRRSDNNYPSDNNGGSSDTRGDVIIIEEQRKGNTIISNNHLVENINGVKHEQQQNQPQQQQEEDEEEKNREWQLETQIRIGKHEKQKMVPSSFYRAEKSMVDVNEWWKMMERKIQSRQQKEQRKEGQQQQQQLDSEGDRDESTKQRGKIALIMSYPNSGTSYTSKLVRQASGTTTATNYGMETLISTTDHKSVPVYNYSLDGPYWLHPPSQFMDDGTTDVEGTNTLQTKREVFPIPPSTASILTKTHCGIRCTHCPPPMYLENEETFFQRCLSGSRKVPDKSKNSKKLDDNDNNNNKKQYYKKEYVTYSPNLIHSAIHLIRNPFDNAISRFHHELKERTKNPTKYQSWINRYPRNSLGFRKWCNDENTMYGAYEREPLHWTKYGYDPDITKYFEGVSCHAEMVRYALWHVLAIRTAERLGVPIMYVYYEDYAEDLKGETEKLLSFLNLTRSVDEEGNQVELPEFRQSDYSDYFTLEERAAASELIRRVVRNEKGIELLDRYFTEWDFQKLVEQAQDIV
ncbi:hypothetical protein ACHAWT_000385 [Skeletonema menzelii]